MTRLTIETFAQSLLCVVVQVVVASKCGAFRIQYFIAWPMLRAFMPVYSKWITFPCNSRLAKLQFLVAGTATATPLRPCSNSPTNKYICNAFITLQTNRCKCKCYCNILQLLLLYYSYTYMHKSYAILCTIPDLTRCNIFRAAKSRMWWQHAFGISMHCVDKTKGGELLPHAYMTAYTCSFYEKCHSSKETDFGVC